MGTRYQGTDEERDALNAFITLARAANSVMARLLPFLDEHGLTETQFGVIETLYFLGPMCQRELGRKNLKSSGNITLVVANLEKRRLVRRERSDDDRRYIVVYLTESGRELVEAVFPTHVRNVVSVMRILTPAEQQELRRLCRIVGKQERDDAHAPSFGNAQQEAR
jgi:MarR family 2-MHQ and catechol resistance regulon transcriptional repressor